MIVPAELGRSRPIALCTPPEADKGEGGFASHGPVRRNPLVTQTKELFALAGDVQHSSFEWMEVVMAHRVCPGGSATFWPARCDALCSNRRRWCYPSSAKE